MNAAAQQPDGSLPAARERLRTAIHTLIEPQPHTIHRDHQPPEITWIDSLYDQLVDAVAGQSGERSGRHTTSPIWADVVMLLDKIHAAVREWHPQFPDLKPTIHSDPLDFPVPIAVARLQALQARKWRPQDTTHINDIAARIENFAEDIRRLLSGERILFLYAAQGRDLAPCPQCGQSIIRRPDPDDNTKTVRQPALQIKADGTTHCINKECRATWPNPQFLARLLGYEPPQGVLE